MVVIPVAMQGIVWNPGACSLQFRSSFSSCLLRFYTDFWNLRKPVVIREGRDLGAVGIGEGDEEVQTSGYRNKWITGLSYAA